MEDRKKLQKTVFSQNLTVVRLKERCIFLVQTPKTNYPLPISPQFDLISLHINTLHILMHYAFLLTSLPGMPSFLHSLCIKVLCTFSVLPHIRYVQLPYHF